MKSRYAVKPQSDKAGQSWASGKLADNIEEGVLQYAVKHGQQYAVDGELIVAIAPELSPPGRVDMHAVRLYKITYLPNPTAELYQVKRLLRKAYDELDSVLASEIDKAVKHIVFVESVLSQSPKIQVEAI